MRIRRIRDCIVRTTVSATIAPQPIPVDTGARHAVPSARLRAAALVAGGLVSAAGHLLHPLDHSESARAVARFELVHYLFIVGAMLLLAGFPLLRERLGGDRSAAFSVGCLSVATMIIPTLVALEAFASPHVDQETFDRISDSAGGPGAISTVALILGTLGCGVLAWRRTRHRVFGAALVASVIVLVLVPALPGKEGYGIIASLGVLNVALAALGAQWAGRGGEGEAAGG
jgi:hypothetical protein